MSLHNNSDIDHTSGDFDATMSMHGWAYSAVSEPDQGLINAESLESLHPVEDGMIYSMY